MTHAVSCQVMFKIKTRIILIFFLCVATHLLNAQKLLNTFQLNGGLISNEVADLYLGKVDYLPQLKWENDVFRAGLSLSGLYTLKEVEAAGGVNFSIRLKEFSALNGNLPLAGIYLRPAFEVTTSSSKVLSTTLSFELTQFAVNISYGRDFEFDNNWISTGFAFLFSKPERDEDE